MTEFKQIIGRGTRVRDDYGKLWFNILDYTGSATRQFADPEFDGDTAFISQEEIDAAGKRKKSSTRVCREATSSILISRRLSKNRRRSSGESIISMKATSRSRRTWFMSSIPTANNCVF